MTEDGATAWWYNLAWPIRGSHDGVQGKIERIEDLSTDFVMKSASVKKKKKKTNAKDIYDNKIAKKKKKKKKKGKKGKTQYKKVRVQYVKAKLEKQEINFKTRYHVATGTFDIIGKINEIKGMIGSSGPLVLGRTKPNSGVIPRVFGIYEMQLTKVAVDGVQVDDLGRMTCATVGFTLTQAKKKIKKQSNKFPGQSAKEILKFWVENPDELPKQYESAVKISPDPWVKKLWKKKKEEKKAKKKKGK